jgi:superfamily II DNA/RNA helicase
MVITSESGSGKTLAYLMPILNEIYQHDRSESHFVLNEHTEN